MRACMLVILLFVLTGLILSPASAVSYKSTVIGGLPGYAVTEATGINNRGQVVGYCRDSYATTFEAFIWDAENGLRSLGYACAASINNDGEVVGDVPPGYNETLWRWDSDHGFTYLNETGFVTDINDAGVITGRAQQGACIWDKDNVIEYLAEPTNLWARCINNNGVIAGNSFSSSYPVVWTTNTEVTSLPGLFGDNEYIVQAINDHDIIVGYTGRWLSYNHGVYWKKSSDGIYNIFDLGFSKSIFDINNNDQMVGRCRTSKYGAVACVWDNIDGNYTMTQLCDYPSCADVINDNGWIVGSSDMGLVLWQPVPEPGSIISLLLGLGGFAGIMRRRVG